MHGVVAMLHEHSVEFTELHGKGYASTWTKAIHVLAAFFPRGHIGCAAVAGEDLAFFKMDVDGVIPAGAGVLQRPDLPRARCGRRGDPAVIGLQHGSTICLDTPRIFIVRIGKALGSASEFKRPLTYHRDVREIGVRNHLCGNLA